MSDWILIVEGPYGVYRPITNLLLVTKMWNVFSLSFHRLTSNGNRFILIVVDWRTVIFKVFNRVWKVDIDRVTAKPSKTLIIIFQMRFIINKGRAFFSVSSTFLKTFTKIRSLQKKKKRKNPCHASRNTKSRRV